MFPQNKIFNNIIKQQSELRINSLVLVLEIRPLHQHNITLAIMLNKYFVVYGEPCSLDNFAQDFGGER